MGYGLISLYEGTEKMRELKGITWGHVRGINPLEAATKEFEEQNPNIIITWDSRSLEDFENYPIEQLANNYDLIMIDHPFIGTGVHESAIESLDDWIEKDFLQDQKSNSLGGSFESYTWNDKQWALPVDAASQIAAYRKDLFEKLNIEFVPSTFEEVDDLIDLLPSEYKIGIPLSPTHSFCSFISVAANINEKDFYNEGVGFNEDISVKTLSIISKWKKASHKISIDSNPINMFDHMAITNEIVYIPFIFGYSNYGRKNTQGNLINFLNIPSYSDSVSGSILGGVGIALSAKSNYKSDAIQFIKYITSEQCQCGIYTAEDGQPAYKKAWLLDDTNEKTNNFFKDTLQTIEKSYTRPRFYGFIEFQKQAGELIHDFFKKDKTSFNSLIKEINQLYKVSLK